MHTRICKYAPAFLLLASLGVAGCDNDGVFRSTANLTGPAATTSTTSTIVTVEPTTIRPEFLPHPFCHTPPPFQTRFTLVVRADRDDVTVRDVSFEFVDRFGGRSVPTSLPSSSPIPISGTSPVTTPGTSPIPIPGTSPITIPGTSPIPIPGTSPFDGLVIPLIPLGGSFPIPFLLQFNCGIPAFGTLFVIVRTTDRHGRHDDKRVSIGVDGN